LRLWKNDPRGVELVEIQLFWGCGGWESTIFESYNWADSNVKKGFFPVMHRPTSTSLL
jgi:hypothetical protein